MNHKGLGVLTIVFLVVIIVTILILILWHFWIPICFKLGVCKIASQVCITNADCGGQMVCSSGKCYSTGLDTRYQQCLTSGGTVGTGMCCSSVSDFPNTCSIGACGCSPTNSHAVQVCNCPSGYCFDGNTCVGQNNYQPNQVTTQPTYQITTTAPITTTTVFTPLKIIIPTCEDSDNGKITTVAGTCKDATHPGGYNDYCSEGGGVVNEYYCRMNQCQVLDISCPAATVCLDGRCVNYDDWCMAKCTYQGVGQATIVMGGLSCATYGTSWCASKCGGSNLFAAAGNVNMYGVQCCCFRCDIPSGEKCP